MDLNSIMTQIVWIFINLFITALLGKGVVFLRGFLDSFRNVRARTRSAVSSKNFKFITFMILFILSFCMTLYFRSTKEETVQAYRYMPPMETATASPTKTALPDGLEIPEGTRLAGTKVNKSKPSYRPVKVTAQPDESEVYGK